MPTFNQIYLCQTSSITILALINCVNSRLAENLFPEGDKQRFMLSGYISFLNTNNIYLFKEIESNYALFRGGLEI